MTVEARLAFILSFFVLWSIMALVPWAAVAVISRGRGSAIALPLCLAAGCAFGVAVPVLGARDAAGFLVSIFMAFIASGVAAIAVMVVVRRMDSTPQEDRPGVVVPSTRRRPPA